METTGKPTNAEEVCVVCAIGGEDGLGGVTVSFFDHHGLPGPEQCVGSHTFPHCEDIRDNHGGFIYTTFQMTRVIDLHQQTHYPWLLPRRPCFAFTREFLALPTQCAKNDSDQGPYMPIWLAYGDWAESRIFDEGGNLVFFDEGGDIFTATLRKALRTQQGG